MGRRDRAAAGRRQERCVYCGQAPATTRDHVVSKGLYVAPYPNNLLTVPACWPCNQRKSASEDSLRDFLSMDLLSAPAPDARSLFHSTVARAVVRNRSKIARELVQHGRRIPIYSPGGLFAGFAFAVDLPDDPVSTTLAFMVRGLYFALCGARLDPTVQIEIRRSMTTPHEFASLWDQATLAEYPRFTQGTVFRCLYAQLPPDPACSVWALQFYERTAFMAESNPRVLATFAAREEA